jgi:hypothetical protein
MKKTKKSVWNPWPTILLVSTGLNILALIYVLKPQVNKLISKNKETAIKQETANLFDEIN